MTLPDGYTVLKALHVGAALVFAGGVLATALLLQVARSLALAARPVARVALRWSRTVTTPAMLLVWTLGLVLGIEGGWFSESWLWAKLVFVLILSALHGVQSGALRRWSGGLAPSPAVRSPAAVLLAVACLIVIAGLAVTKIG